MRKQNKIIIITVAFTRVHSNCLILQQAMMNIAPMPVPHAAMIQLEPNDVRAVDAQTVMDVQSSHHWVGNSLAFYNC